MNARSYIQQAFMDIMAAKMRSSLAMLGVLVGTAAVVALISCGQLATEKALAQFKKLGTDLLAVSVYQQAAQKAHGEQEMIPLSVWRQFPAIIPGVLQIAPYITVYQTMSYQGHVVSGAIIGADESLASIVHIGMTAGHFVPSIESYDQVCVVGDGIARQLQQISLEPLIGKQLRVGQALYTIIGVSSHWQENAFFNEDVNQAIIVPLASVALLSKETKIKNAVLLLNQESNIDDVIYAIKQTLYKQGPKLSVFVRSAKQIIASMENQGHIFTLLLAVIGGISLVVGGIGIMNVMLVSVSERKKEIGIRKAVGAKSHEIQGLFLMESMLLSFIGGLFGVVLGLLFTWIVAYFSQWVFVLHILPPLAGFVVSVVTGVFFGFYPARRAAVLEPAVSLRNE